MDEFENIHRCINVDPHIGVELVHCKDITFESSFLGDEFFLKFASWLIKTITGNCFRY